MSVYYGDNDSTDILILNESLSKVETLGAKIERSLNKISMASLQAEKDIRPISGKTRMLALYDKNITASLNVIKDIKNYAKLSEKCEKVIRAGIGSVGLAGYTQALQDLHTAYTELTGSHLQKFYKVVDKIEQLLKSGNSGIKEYLRGLLAEFYKPVNAAELVNRGAQFPRLSVENAQRLRELVDHFESKNVNVDDIFTDIMIRYATTSLSKLNKSVRLTPQSAKTPVEGLKTYTAALIQCCMSLNDDLDAIFDPSPSKYDATKEKYREEIVKACVGDFEATVAGMNDMIKTTQSNKDGTGVFELVECTTGIIKATTTMTRAPPTRLINVSDKLNATARTVFKDTIKYIETRVQSMPALPNDNGVSDATVESMSRLNKIADHKNSAVIIMKSMAADSWIPTPKPAWRAKLPPVPTSSTDPVEMLACYFSDAIDCLFINLEMKAQSLAKKNSQVGFLLLMNLTMVERFSQKSEIAKIMGGTGAERLERLRKRAMDMFLEGWHNVAQNLMDVTYVRPGNKQLSSKDREAIKEKFKTFNAEFDGLVQNHKACNITDPNLKQLVAKELRFIIPLYHRFYDRHIGGDFTKNVDKYIKYNKDQFDAVIRSLT